MGKGPMGAVGKGHMGSSSLSQTDNKCQIFETYNGNPRPNQLPQTRRQYKCPRLGSHARLRAGGRIWPDRPCAHHQSFTLMLSSGLR